jgi:hypothetical protein
LSDTDSGEAVRDAVYGIACLFKQTRVQQTSILVWFDEEQPRALSQARERVGTAASPPGSTITLSTLHDPQLLI